MRFFLQPIFLLCTNSFSTLHPYDECDPHIPFSFLLPPFFILHTLSQGNHILFMHMFCLTLGLSTTMLSIVGKADFNVCFSSGNVCIIGHVILLGFQMQHFSSVIPDLFFIPRNDYILAIFIRTFYIYTA